MRSLFHTLALGLWILALPCLADLAPLDDRYEGLIPPVDDVASEFEPLLRWNSQLPTAQDFKALIQAQTPVKSQGSRGLCAVFSALGILESRLKKQLNQEWDLSENYLAYILDSKFQKELGKGTPAPKNFEAIRYPGVIQENLWPYEGDDWRSKDASVVSWVYAYFTCSFSGLRQEICLSTHRDPDNDPFEKNAHDFSKSFNIDSLYALEVDTVSEIQGRLLKQEPLILEMDFYYGAWNHYKMKEIGLGTPDSAFWTKGEVRVPSEADLQAFKEHPMGHSVIVVGFDLSRKVYFFKNSWGSSSFGVQSDLLGPRTSPGYGTIPFEYAHAHGMFYRISER